MKQVTRKKSIATVFLFLIILIGIRLLWNNYIATLDYPENYSAVQGVLDVRDVEFSNKQTMPLNGEWEFYPSVFLTSEEDISTNVDKRYIQVPGSWAQTMEKESESQFHYGTYRLQILVDENNENTFGIRTNRINSASEVYVNGHVLGKSGQTSTEEETFQAYYLPYKGTMIPENNKIEIFIHVSNNFEQGGIVRPIRFGTIEAIDYRTTLSVGSQLLVALIFILHVLYAMTIYFVGARRGKELVYFSLFGLCAIFAVLVADDKLFFGWVTVDAKWIGFLSMMPYLGYSLFIPLLADSVFPSHRRKKPFKLALILSSLTILLVIFSLSDISNLVQYQGIPLFFSFFVAAFIYWDAEQEMDEAIYLTLSIVALLFDFGWSFVMHGQSLEIMHYPVNFILYVLLFGAFWFRRYVRLHSEANQLTEKLKLEDKRKDEFLVNTSHELRNPLHAIINIIQAMSEDKVNPPSKEHKKRLEMLIVVAKRMAQMLNDLLDITRLKEETIKLHLANIRLDAVVAGVVDLIRLSIGGKPVLLQVEIPDAFPAVKADETRLTQILFNLIHNAVKFTDKGSILIRAEVKNGEAHISVEDTGIGIEKEELHKIFQPYEQASTNSIRASGGFGLGLNICKYLVELHGGTLTVQSTPQKGSIFTFTLPVYADVENKEQSSRSLLYKTVDLAVTEEDESKLSTLPNNEKTQQSNMAYKILVVDDDNINLHVLTQILEGEGYDITAVSSAFVVMNMLKTNQYDLVISDVMMPQISGYKLTQMIRDQYSISELPVLLLTAKVRTEDILAGFQAGANDYVQKPVDAWELKARVRALINLKISIEERLQMEGAWLQSQIEPHFISNALNSIAALAVVDVNKMEELLYEFSNFLRLSIDFRNADRVVPIHHELSIVQSYLFIEKVRFKERLSIQWDLDDDIDVKVPPLSIQPLVENAIIHGILKGEGHGTILIRIKKDKECVEITVTDDGIGMTAEQVEQLFIKKDETKGRTSVGLLNINRRLKQLYGKGLIVQSTPEKGTTFSFTIPK